MKIKEGFLLKQTGEQYIAVPFGLESEAFDGIIRLNSAGAYLWKELEQGISEDALVAKMMERYSGLDEQTARNDLREFLRKINMAMEES